MGAHQQETALDALWFRTAWYWVIQSLNSHKYGSEWASAAASSEQIREYYEQFSKQKSKRTMVQNSLISRHLIIHFPTSSWVREWAIEWTNEHSRSHDRSEHWAVWRKANEEVVQANKWMDFCLYSSVFRTTVRWLSGGHLVVKMKIMSLWSLGNERWKEEAQKMEFRQIQTSADICFHQGADRYRHPQISAYIRVWIDTDISEYLRPSGCRQVQTSVGVQDS